MQFPWPLHPFISEHEGSQRTRLRKGAPLPAETPLIEGAGAWWNLQTVFKSKGPDRAVLSLRAEVESGTAKEVAAGMEFADTDWGTDNYVLIPGAVYAGNRFRVESYGYPPPPLGPGPGEDRSDLRIIDLPRLAKEEGPSHLDQLSIDAATPGLGIYFPRRQKALLVLTRQESNVGPCNYEIIESADRRSAQILFSTPGIRHGAFFGVPFQKPGGFSTPSEDRTIDIEKGRAIELELHLHWFDCENVHGLFERLFRFRKSCFSDPPLRDEIPFSETFRIIEEKQNRENWREDMALYQTSILGKREPPVPALLFQTGWCGGMIGTYPLLQDGTPLSVARCLRSLSFFFTGFAPSGLLHPLFDGRNWTWVERDESPETSPKTTLTRRVGDALYFLLRQLTWLRENGHGEKIQPLWEFSLRHNVETVCRIWRAHGDLGQYLDLDSGEVAVAGTTSGALIPAGLLLAADYFKEPAYAEAASEIADFYRVHDLAEAITTGGPGDAMQAPDSESPFALLESFILLYERSGEECWLKAARQAAVQAASWVMSYDYRFPAGSALDRIGAQSRGAILANAQNKTAVPGICTLSGQGLLRLYRQCGDPRFLELLHDIAHSIPQYMGRRDKRIPCAFSNGNPHDHQPVGWICERVNITQWGEPIGELFAYSTWCEVAMMLSFADLPGLYVDLDSPLLVAFDHVEAEWIRDNPGRPVLRLRNPTPFPARVRLLCESDADRKRPLPVNAAASWPLLDLPPHSGRRFAADELPV